MSALSLNALLALYCNTTDGPYPTKGMRDRPYQVKLTVLLKYVLALGRRKLANFDRLYGRGTISPDSKREGRTLRTQIYAATHLHRHGELKGSEARNG